MQIADVVCLFFAISNPDLFARFFSFENHFWNVSTLSVHLWNVMHIVTGFGVQSRPVKGCAATFSATLGVSHCFVAVVSIWDANYQLTNMQVRPGMSLC